MAFILVFICICQGSIDPISDTPYTFMYLHMSSIFLYSLLSSPLKVASSSVEALGEMWNYLLTYLVIQCWEV